MRELTAHKTNDCNETIRVFAAAEPKPSGACHVYQIRFPDPRSGLLNLFFQNGPVKENGVNGITNEALLAILIDRLEGFQQGPFECVENANALVYLRAALRWLKWRTLDRRERGVEGTLQP